MIARVAAIDDSIVQPISAALPELESLRGDFVTAPVRREGDGLAGESVGEFLGPLFQSRSFWKGLRLRGSPSADLGTSRAAVEIGQ